MTQWVPIQKSQHSDTYWLTHNTYYFTQQDASAPLLLAEISQALLYYPLVFLQKKSDQFQLAALQSLQPNVNLFVNHQGQWRVPYIPSAYRGYPFALIPNTKNELIFCIDQDSGLFVKENPPEANALFSDNGRLSQKTSEVLTFLQQREINKKITQRAVDALARHSLMVPWEIKTQNKENKTVLVEGIYKINEEKLNTLEESALADLQKNNALALAYGQLFSQARLQDFSRYYQASQYEQQQTQSVDLDQMFGESEEDVFKF